MNAESLYKTSKDHKQLYDLLVAGHQIICFVDFRYRGDSDDEPRCRDICVAKARESEICAEARGIGYLSIFRDYPQCEEIFIKYCNQINLVYVVPESQQLEQMKCCGNCADQYTTKSKLVCKTCTRNLHGSKKSDNWSTRGGK